MSKEVNIETNPIDLLKNGEKFRFKKGQTFVTGEFVAEDGAEYVVPDRASIIQE